MVLGALAKLGVNVGGQFPNLLCALITKCNNQRIIGYHSLLYGGGFLLFSFVGIYSPKVMMIEISRDQFIVHVPISVSAISAACLRSVIYTIRMCSI